MELHAFLAVLMGFTHFSDAGDKSYCFLGSFPPKSYENSL
jgi:hypothetical protein